MKKQMCKILSTALALSFLVQTAMASGTQGASSKNIEVIRFTEFIRCFFENPNVWHVADCHGTDISAQYYTDNIGLYESGNFAELMKRSDGLVDSLFQPGDIDNYNAVARASSASRTTYNDFICVVDGNFGGVVPSDSEVYVTLTGNYEVDNVNDIVTKVSAMSPSVRLDGFGSVTSGSVSYSISNVRRSASFTSEKARFTANFDIFVTYGAHDYADFCGNYTITIIGDTNGGRSVGYEPDDGTGNRYVYPN